MSRESAIVFLRHIRSNIEHLQAAYTDQATTMGEDKVIFSYALEIRFALIGREFAIDYELLHDELI